jgi:hypothetical protein
MYITCGAGTANPSGAPEFTPVFSGVRVARSLLFCIMFCRSLFIRLYFFFWPFCCLSFFDLRLLVTSLISLNFSYFDDDASVTNIQSGQFSCLTIGGYLVDR